MPTTGRTETSRAIRAATATLAAAGLPSPRADAEQLAAHVLGLPRSRLVLAPALSPVQAERLSALVTARAERVPLQHLTGVAAFHHIDVPVGPGVFVPRPETELLVEWGLRAAGSVIVDLCSGSGRSRWPWPPPGRTRPCTRSNATRRRWPGCGATRPPPASGWSRAT